MKTLLEIFHPEESNNMKELITITYNNGGQKKIERDYKKGVPAMDILILLNKQGHNVNRVDITAKGA